jgi:hypothetical protein
MILSSKIQVDVCSDFLQQTIEHLRTCEQCRMGIIKLFTDYPILGMFVSANSLFEIIDKEHKWEQ